MGGLGLAATGNTMIWPEVTLIGERCLQNLGAHMKEMGSKKAVIVTDSFMCKAGVDAQIAGILSKSGIDTVVFDGVAPNPTIEIVNNLVNIYLDQKCDSLVSLGGGSAHDTAKAVKLLIMKGNLGRSSDIVLAAVNTTAGTGSEVSKFCIITDAEKQHKLAIVNRLVVPDIAVDDPVLMVGMPPSLTAATGVDALTHSIEAYTAVDHCELTDCMAVKATELIFKNLPICYKNGSNIKAREGMAYAAYMAGMAFSNAGLGLVHAMAHQLGGVYNLAHGVCNAVLLPFVMEFNFDINMERYAELAQKAGLVPKGLPISVSAKNFIRMIKSMNMQLKLPQNIKTLGVREADFEMLADKALQDFSLKGNSKTAFKADIVNLYRRAYIGENSVC